MNFEINELACQCRRDWNICQTVPVDILNIVLNKIPQLTVSFFDMGKNISGACSKSNSYPVIFVNSKHSKGRQNFTLAHEIYHLKFDETQVNICGIHSRDETEKNADLFASCLIMPHGALMEFKKYHNTENWSIESVISCEQYFQMSHTALLYRLKDLGEITNREFLAFRKNVKQIARANGYPANLYEPVFDRDAFTFGYYLRMVENCFENELISNGLKEELLLEANREDIVFDI